ncbi:MAG TPA: IS4 family transposase [Chloroflexota bacterium]|nr:IS4 family transposase [Chloroflexota bacterium]
MGLRGWSWDAAAGPAGAGHRPLLEALEVALPDAAVEEVIERTGTRERRRRVLPTHLVVTLVVAMGLWAEGSVRHALAAVVDGWREAREQRAAALGPPPAGPGGRPPWRLPSTAAIVRARRRAGVRLFRELFGAVAGPLATPATPGAFLGGLRLMAIDGTTLDVADTPENARAFGRPTTHRGAGAFPQLRAVALIETGTHALCDVVLRPFRGGEAPAARHLLRAVGPGMLLLWDRGFHGYDMLQRTRARGAHFLGRTKTNVVLLPTEGLPDGSYLSVVYPSPKARRRRAGGIAVRVVEYALDTPACPGTERYRLLTSLLDPAAFPAPALAATYHERWEVETALAEVKVHQWAHPRPLRSKRPREVVQEVYGLLLAHLAIRTLMYQAALRDGVDPDRLSFTGALRVLRRAIPRAQRAAPKRLPLVYCERTERP